MIEKVFSDIFNNCTSVEESFLTTCSKLNGLNYFQSKHYKNTKFEILKNYFNSEKIVSQDVRLVLGSNFAFENWGGIQKFLKVKSVDFLEKSFFLEDNTNAEFKDKCNFLNGKIVLTTNHDICKDNLLTLKNLQRFYLDCDQTIFTGWDWDNHHNLAISSVYALNSDIYFPSQRANDYELSVISNRMCFLAPSAYEWSRDFLVDNFELIINSNREKEIFGVFNSYPRFVLRNQYIATLNKDLPDIKFIEEYTDYLDATPKAKLAQWCGAKWHWIIPTFNAVSVRAFYSLISGVGVILPIEFRCYEEFSRLDERDVVWYTCNDVLDTSRVRHLARKKFEESGLDGVIRRHRWALDNHNLDNRVEMAINKILKFLRE